MMIMSMIITMMNIYDHDGNGVHWDDDDVHIDDVHNVSTNWRQSSKLILLYYIIITGKDKKFLVFENNHIYFFLVGVGAYHLLSWENDDTAENWVPEEFFNILSNEGETQNTLEEESCQTWKSRDKRVLRHTVGILVGTYPCGNISLFDELYGSESLSQVYAILADYTANIPEEARNKLDEIVYDDACHLKKYAENPARANRNDTTRKRASIEKHVTIFFWQPYR